MTINLDSLRIQLREGLGLDGDDVTELPNVDSASKTGADTFLNRAYWELLEKFDFREKEVIGTFPTTASVNYYAIPSPFDALRSLSIEDLNDQSHKPLDRITRDVFEQKYENRTDAESKPQLYFREDAGIRFWPTPDDAYTITISYWDSLSNLSDINSSPPIPRSWHELILHGGIWRAKAGPFRDYDGAKFHRTLQSTLLEGIETTDSKEAFDSHRAGLEVLGLDSEL